MLLRISLLIGGYTAAAICLAQSATLAASMDVYVFPTEGQDETQQSMDEAECYNWAVDRSGSDPFQLAQQAQQQMAAADQAMREAENAGQGSAGRSAVAGAATGALIGAAFGSSSKTTRRTAAAGAAIGGAMGSRRSSQASAQATEQVAAQSAQEQAAIEQQMTNFKNAFGACLEGKNYIARS